MNDIVKVAWKHAHTRALSSDRLKTNVAVFSTDFDRFFWNFVYMLLFKYWLLSVKFVDKAGSFIGSTTSKNKNSILIIIFCEISILSCLIFIYKRFFLNSGYDKWNSISLATLRHNIKSDVFCSYCNQVPDM